MEQYFVKVVEIRVMSGYVDGESLDAVREIIEKTELTLHSVGIEKSVRHMIEFKKVDE